jgi:predicted heme/steroid binding protein
MIEDNPGDARIIQDMLVDAKNIEFTIDWKQTLTGGLESLSESKYDAVLLDLGLPDSPQRSASFTRVQTAAPILPIVILTGLDDETFAVTSVRRGAQDYLVKGKIDTDTLVRTIRYAIARKMGGERQFTIAELSQYDGKEGRPAYVAFKGKVYDATNSRLWKSGKHGAIHLAGADLTEAFAKAPHGEEVLARLPILGYLSKKETYGQQLFRRIDKLHPHATLVHLSIAYTIAAPFSFLAWIFSGQAVFDEITLYLLALGMITVPLSFLTGVISWIVNYETKATISFNLKFAIGVLLFLVITGTFILRLAGSNWVLGSPGSYYFLAALVIQLALALTSDFLGKRIVYS